MLTVRIPLGRGGQRSCSRLSRLNRRMVTPIVRDVDIVTNAGAFGTSEAARFASTGALISQTLVVDGGTMDPESVIEGAGGNSLIIAQGDLGNILPAGEIDMPMGQMILGGGSGLAVIGGTSGAPATFVAPGTRPTIDNSIVMNSGGALIGLDINGQGATAAINLVGTGNFEIFGSNVTNVDMGMTNNVAFPKGAQTTEDIAEAGIFGQNYTGNLTISNATLNTPSNALLLSPASGNIVVADSQLMTSVNETVDIRIFGGGTVSANFANTQITSNGRALQNFASYDSSTLTGLFKNVFISGTREGISNLRAEDNSTLVADFNDSEITGAVMVGEAINNIVSRGNAMMTVNFDNVKIHSPSQEAINNLIAYDNSKFTASFTDSTITGGANAVEAINLINSWSSSTYEITFTNNLIQGGNGRAINAVQARGDSTMQATFVDNQIIGSTREGIRNVGSSDDATFTGIFTNNSIISNTEGILNLTATGNSNSMLTFTGNSITSQTQEAIGNLGSSDMATFTGNFAGNTITSLAADTVDADSSDTSTTNLSFMGNTLSSPAGFIDFNFSQAGGSLFNVVDYPNLSGDNNGASVNTSGTINNIPALP